LRIEPVLAAPSRRAYQYYGGNSRRTNGYVDSASDYYVIDDGLPRFAEDTPPERVT
jgi:hypothetical protein